MCDILLQTQKSDSNIVIEWHINDFTNSIQYVLPKQVLHESKWCLFLSLNWYLEIHESLSSPGWISFGICLEDDLESELEREIHVGYTIEIKKTDGSVYKIVKGKHTFSVADYKCKVERFVERYSLLEDVDVLLPNGQLTVLCTLCDSDNYVEEIPEIPLPHFCLQTLSQNLKDLFLHGHYGDVKIKVGEREFQSHMPILAARSPVFDSMFRHDTSEKRTCTIDITDCSPEAFQDFLVFIYAGQLDLESCCNVLDLYKTADKYDIKELKDKCSGYLARQLSIDNICDVMSLAVMYDESKLLEISTEYFIEKVGEILPTESWKAFMRDNHLFANELTIKMVNRYYRKIRESEKAHEDEEGGDGDK